MTNRISLRNSGIRHSLDNCASKSGIQTGGSVQTDALAEQLAEEMRTAWHQGQRPAAEVLLGRYPELGSHPQAGVRLVYEELCLRQEFGLETAASLFVKRFPQWQRELKFLLECHDLLQPLDTEPSFPEVGQTWADYSLLAELGRGGFGRVFLAKQSSLSDRPVVLKMMAADDGEHLSLARLQHTNIVPLYAIQEDPERQIRALCMPYFGGASFKRILELLADKPAGERTGQDIVNALDRLQDASPIRLPRNGPSRQLLARASYVQAVGWIGSSLAEALHYAHERGLVHLDLKPHNVLLASDGQAMLLDFNLARQPLQPGDLGVDSFGGTPEYMSPEQEQALAEIRAGLPIGVAVGAGSDIYSLGLVLYEALGGAIRFAAPGRRGAAYLRQSNPQVSCGLADLIHKCLAPSAGDRYADAAALAADLRRQLADLPLRDVRNRSWCERWGKWRRRRPQTLVHAGVLLTLLAAVSLAGISLWRSLDRQRREAEQALSDGQGQLQNHAYADAERIFHRALALAENLPGGTALRQQLKGQLRLAQRAHAAQQLHSIADRLRFLYGMEPLPAGQANQWEAQCRQIWQKRDLLRSKVEGPVESRLEKNIQEDLRDLAILWADLHVRLAASDQMDEARQEALRLLGEAEALFGSSVILARARRDYAEALGRGDLAQAAARHLVELAPQTAWEHYSLGRFLLRSGNTTEAMAEFDLAVELRPQDFWPNFYQGACAFRLQRYEAALEAFRVCLALAPACAECFYHRGLAEAALGRTERAVRDYSQALQMDPTLTAAAVNRGILHYQLTRYTEALQDFHRALENGADSAALHYNIALVHLARKDDKAALSSLRRALEQDSHHQEARALYDRLLRRR
jgi:serine/threonine protein kinase/Tfp pilus assembly protein PilF